MTTVDEELAQTQSHLDDLGRWLTALQTHLGDSLDMRRARTDADHLRESLQLLRSSARSTPMPAGGPADVVRISDAPYDPGLWRDCEDDEGLGSSYHHAP